MTPKENLINVTRDIFYNHWKSMIDPEAGITEKDVDFIFDQIVEKKKVELTKEFDRLWLHDIGCSEKEKCAFFKARYELFGDFS